MGILNMLLPFILIFGIFYFLVFLTQKKQQKNMAMDSGHSADCCSSSLENGAHTGIITGF